MSFARFKKEWASDGPRDPFNDAEAAEGWSSVGDAPPTVEQWNAVQNELDWKDNWLFRQIEEVHTPAGLVPSADVLTSLRDAIRFLIGRSGLVGEVKVLARPDTPSGFLPCDGRAVSRQTFSQLFSAIGTTYGPGDGSTTFNLPDYRGRAIVGHDQIGGTRAMRLTVDSGTSGILGAAGGSQYSQQHDHGFRQLPHTHAAVSFAAGEHTHTGYAEQAGFHAHSGTTAFSGDHVHQQASESLYNHGGGGVYIGERNWVYQPGLGGSDKLFSAYQFQNTTAAGNHFHVLQIDGGGAHWHNVVTWGAGSHNHPVSLTPGLADIQFSSFGQGNSQNMPPFATANVVIFTGVFQ